MSETPAARARRQRTRDAELTALGYELEEVEDGWQLRCRQCAHVWGWPVTITRRVEHRQWCELPAPTPTRPRRPLPLRRVPWPSGEPDPA